jgi:hypothetical protein
LTLREAVGAKRGRRLLAVAAMLLLGQAVVGCDTGGLETPSPKVITAVGLRLQRNDLSGAELTRATAWAEEYAASLVTDHAELAGLQVRGIFPVFDEASPAPIGAMARLVLPAPVPSVELDLIRSKAEVPQKVRSYVTQLRSLDAIFEFRGGQVIFLGISPLPTDATDPATATQARPDKPESHRDSSFGEDE